MTQPLTNAQKATRVRAAYREGRLSFVQAWKLLRQCSIPSAMAVTILRRTDKQAA